MRPHYEPAELDKECEKILAVFFGGHIPTPIDTDSLAKLIDRDTSDFDPGADLSHYGPDVEGVTEFLPPRKPKVRIVAELVYDEVRHNRYLYHPHPRIWPRPFSCSTFLLTDSSRGADLFSAATGGKRRRAGVQTRQHHQCPQDRLDGVAGQEPTLRSTPDAAHSVAPVSHRIPGEARAVWPGC